MRCALIVSIALLAAQTAFAGSFTADPDKLCIGSPGARRVDPDKILWELLKAHDLSPNDLSIGRKDNSYDLRAQAVLDPRAYCTSRQCGKDVEKRLSAAQGDLLTFWDSNSRPPDAKAKFQTSPHTVKAPPDIVLESFFREAAPAKAICIDKKKDSSGPTAGKRGKVQDGSAEENAQIWQPELRVRKATSGLKIPQSAAGFASVDRASFSFARNYLTSTDTYNIDGVAGISLGAVPLDNIGVARVQMIPYAGVTRQLVKSRSNPASTDVRNFKAGFLSNWIIPVGDYAQSLDIFPEVVHSVRTKSSILSGNVTWTPDAPIPGIGAKYHPYQGSPVSFLIQPQLKASYSRPLDDGGDPLLGTTKDFSRAGPSISFAWFVESGAFAGLSHTTTYDYLKVFRGGPNSKSYVPRFETTLAYTMPGQEFWAVELKYVDGRVLETLEAVRQLTLGVGFKY